MPSILIVSAFFPPSLRIGSRRPARMALYLSRSGWDVTVLTMYEWRHIRPVDMPEEPPPPGMRVIRTGAWMPIDALRRAGVALAGRRRAAPPSEGKSDASDETASRADALSEPRADSAQEHAVLGPSPSGAFKSWCARRLADLEFPDKYAGWLPRALFASQGRRWDVVLATIPAYTPAVVARIVSAKTASPLVLDYRDPWTEAPRRDFGEGWHEGLRDRHRRLEDWCLAGTSLAIGVAPGICRFLEARTRAEILLAPNSYDADDPAYPRMDGASSAPPGAAGPARGSAVATGPSWIVYAGTLAYGRSLDPVFAALGRLAPAVGPDRLRFVYAGPDSARVRHEARARGVEAYLEDLRMLGASAAATLVKEAAAVVVAVSEGYEYQYPGKIFDVVASGRPVLLLAPRGADAAELVRRHGLGWTHEHSDIDGIAESIRRAMAGEMPRPTGLEVFETRRVMASLEAALRRLV